MGAGAGAGVKWQLQWQWQWQSRSAPLLPHSASSRLAAPRRGQSCTPSDATTERREAAALDRKQQQPNIGLHLPVRCGKPNTNRKDTEAEAVNHCVSSSSPPSTSQQPPLEHPRRPFCLSVSALLRICCKMDALADFDLNEALKSYNNAPLSIHTPEASSDLVDCEHDPESLTIALVNSVLNPIVDAIAENPEAVARAANFDSLQFLLKCVLYPSRAPAPIPLPSLALADLNILPRQALVCHSHDFAQQDSGPRCLRPLGRSRHGAP